MLVLVAVAVAVAVARLCGLCRRGFRRSDTALAVVRTCDPKQRGTDLTLTGRGFCGLAHTIAVAVRCLRTSHAETGPKWNVKIQWNVTKTKNMDTKSTKFIADLLQICHAWLPLFWALFPALTWGFDLLISIEASLLGNKRCMVMRGYKSCYLFALLRAHVLGSLSALCLLLLPATLI